MEALVKKLTEFLMKQNVLDDRKHLVVLFSGGKDCSVLLHLLTHVVAETFTHISLHPVTVVYPRHMYDDEIITDIKSFWHDRGLKLTTLSNSTPDPENCAECKTVRKRLLDPFVENFAPAETVIASGYTLLDYVSYIEEIRTLTDSTYNLDRLSADELDGIQRNLCKIRVVQDLPTGYRITRPLGVLNYKQVEDYRDKHTMPMLRTPCWNYAQKFKRSHIKSLSQICNDMTYERLLADLADKNITIPDSLKPVAQMNFFSDC